MNHAQPMVLGRLTIHGPGLDIRFHAGPDAIDCDLRTIGTARAVLAAARRGASAGPGARTSMSPLLERLGVPVRVSVRGIPVAEIRAGASNGWLSSILGVPGFRLFPGRR